jgi:hypothetical protein
LEKTPCAEREAERTTGAITSIALLIRKDLQQDTTLSSPPQ